MVMWDSGYAECEGLWGGVRLFERRDFDLIWRESV